MFYIAEIGLNHNGDIDLAKNMVKAANQAGADAVKFQSINAEKLVSPDTFSENIDGFGFSDVENVGDFWEKVSIDRDFHREINNYCNELGIEFMSTPFDFESVDLLEELGVERYKIASGDLTNYPLIEKIIKQNKPIILSTGGSTIEEIKETVGFIKSGSYAKDLTLLHCVSLYPTPAELANLRAIADLRKISKGPVGYSDHTVGFHISLAAIAQGANVIEKHFTVDQSLPGPDQKISATPEIFEKIVNYGNQIEAALQIEGKQVSRSETKELAGMRRSIVAGQDLKKGTVLSRDNLDYKRPGNGISPKQYSKLIGKRLKKDFKKNEQFQWSALNEE
mgnify:CR=1 FL=1